MVNKLPSTSVHAFSLLYYPSFTTLTVFSFFFVDASLQPYLDQINQIEEQVTALEQAAYKLDTYSKKLGKCN